MQSSTSWNLQPVRYLGTAGNMLMRKVQSGFLLQQPVIRAAAMSRAAK